MHSSELYLNENQAYNHSFKIRHNKCKDNLQRFGLKKNIYVEIMSPEEEQEHCKLDLIVQELDLVVIEQGKLIRSPGGRK